MKYIMSLGLLLAYFSPYAMEKSSIDINTTYQSLPEIIKDSLKGTNIPSTVSQKLIDRYWDIKQNDFTGTPRLIKNYKVMSPYAQPFIPATMAHLELPHKKKIYPFLPYQKPRRMHPHATPFKPRVQREYRPKE